jgi:hypothetical protein
MKYLYLILSITCSAYAGELRPMDSPHFIVIVREFTLNLDEEDNKNVTQNVKNKDNGDHFSFIQKKSGDDFETKVNKYMNNKYDTNQVTPEFSFKKANK